MGKPHLKSYRIREKKMIKKIERQDYANDVDYQYLALAKRILEEGVYRQGRNGGTYSLFGASMRFDLSQGVPLLTTKKIVTRSVIHELIWMLKGDTSAKYLKDNNVGIWDLWINEQGDLPYTYPMMWRKFPNPEGEPVDQIGTIIKQLKTDPYSRRIILSAWNPPFIEKSALPPCHNLCQFYVQEKEGKKVLSCLLYMRSNDFALGNPFNLFQYSLLTYLLAQVCGMQPGELIWNGGDVHIYENQVEAFKTQFDRKSHPLAKIKINPDLKNIDDVKFEDVEIIDYVHEAFLKMPVTQ